MELRYKDKIRPHRAVNPALANIPLYLLDCHEKSSSSLTVKTTLTDAPHMEYTFLSEYGSMWQVPTTTKRDLESGLKTKW